MANLTDIIGKAVAASTSKIEMPANAKSTILNGLSDSILGSLTQTAAKKGGIDQLKGLLTGKADAASSPITALAGKLFSSNVLSGLKLDKGASSALTAAIPAIMGKLGGVLKDQDGDGDVDFQDILITLKGGKGASQGKAGGLLGAASGILGMFKK